MNTVAWTHSSVGDGRFGIGRARLSPSVGARWGRAQGRASQGAWRSQRGRAASSPASQHRVRGRERAGPALGTALLFQRQDSRRRRLGLYFLRITVNSNGRTLGRWGRFTSFANALETHVFSRDS